jgi:FkbM family methyltransferase
MTATLAGAASTLDSPVDEAFVRTLQTRYGRLSVFHNDTGAVTESLLRYGEWAENELRFQHAFVAEGAVVLDVGAYIGTHTLAFSRFAGPSGRVISIEPQSPSFALLQENVAINGIGNVQLENAVASSESGSVLIPAIHIERHDSFGSASLLPARFAEEQAVEPCDVAVRAITIDSLALSACALIKIDAEGMEDAVLRGALLTLQRCAPVVYAECNSLSAGLSTLAVLNGAGYRVLAHVVQAFNPDNFRGVSDNIFGAAREVALVGFAEADRQLVKQVELRPHEMLLEIDSADDLALALLNKPQYVPEILRRSAAARSGGADWLDEADAIRFEAETLRRDIAIVQQDAAAAREETAAARRQAESLSRQAAAASEQAASVSRQAEAAHRDAEAKIDACMRQVGLMRKEADRTKADNHQTKADNQRLIAEAEAARAALAAIQASTSWRLTAPVRRLLMLLGRGRRW